MAHAACVAIAVPRYPEQAVETVSRDEISVRAVVKTLGASKWLVTSLTLGCGIAVGAFAFTQPNNYEATVLLSPVASNSTAGRLGSQTSQIGGLASLIGVNFGGDSTKTESIAYLQSEALTERFVKDNNLLPVLFADRWSATEKKWTVTDPRKVPTLWKANLKFQGIRTVVDDKKSGLVKLTVKWTDAVTAARWANDLVGLANDTLRTRAINESEKHITYLNGEAASTDLAPIRTAIYSVLESEIKNVMLARGPGDYALKVIDPAVAPELKAGPHRSLWVLGGCAGGFVLALLIMFLRAAWRAGAVE
jgi:uncharacterized protein involved in exopolysaccharide biosynthesis